MKSSENVAFRKYSNELKMEDSKGETAKVEVNKEKMNDIKV